MPPADDPPIAPDPPQSDLTDIGEFRRPQPPPRGPAPQLERIGPYRVLRVLGQGGMGTVYLAEQSEPIRRQVAIKVIRAARHDAQFTHRFEAERRALARMSHPAIAQVYEAGDTESGQPYFVMEHVPGVQITEFCDRERLPLEQRLELFVAVCRGIHHAHQKGILHRDIKPANILVASVEGRPVPKIIDFGVAKILDREATESPETVFGMVLGTPSYLSPESIAATTAAEATDPDTRSDVYALGILLFELLVGDRPFGRAGESVIEILRQVSEGEVPAPSARFAALDAKARARRAELRATTSPVLLRRLRGDLDWIVQKATAHRREMRYDSAAELAADVERHAAFRPVLAGPPSRLYALRRLARRHRAGVAAGVAVFVALTAGVTARTLEARRANREAAAARQAQAETQQVVDFLVDLFEVNDPGTARGETITARELLDRGARQIRERLDEQPLSRARLLDTIGQVYRALEVSQPAEPLLREAVAIRERLLGPDHPDVATSLNRLGDLLWIRGEYAEAEAALKRALAIREQHFGAGHLLVADVLDHLGSVYEIQARDAEAKPILERALAIREAALGPDALPVAASLDDLGVFHLDRGGAAVAEPLLRRALAIRERALGADDPEVAVSANGLAIALFSSGRHAESAALHERALAIRERVFGGESAAVAQSLNNLSNVYLALGRSEAAEAALVRAGTIWERALGPEHPRIGIVRYNLADTYLRRGEPARAEPLFRRAAEIFEKAHGAEHPRLAVALQGLAASLKAQGRLGEARAACDRAVAIRSRAFGAAAPETEEARAACAAAAPS